MDTLQEAGAGEAQTGHSNTVTEGIRVRVGARLLPSQSEPGTGKWFYAYRVVIANEVIAPLG